MKIACAVVIKDRKVLVQKRIRKGTYVYEFPMGKVDTNEDFGIAAVRELAEETSLEGQANMVDVRRNEQGFEIGFVYISPKEGSNPVPDDRRKQEYFWYDWSEIPLEDFHDTDIQFIREQIKK